VKIIDRSGPDTDASGDSDDGVADTAPADAQVAVDAPDGPSMPDADAAADADTGSDAGAADGISGDAGDTAKPRHLAKAVAIGSFHACALLDGGAVRCWGRGYAALDPHLARPATAIAAAGPDTCAILDDGEITCWAPSATPGVATTFSPRLDGRRAKSLALVDHPRACALFEDGSLSCWDRTWETGGEPHMTTAPAPSSGAPAADVAMTDTSGVLTLYSDGTVGPVTANALGPHTLIVGRHATSIASLRGQSWGWCATLEGGGVHCEGAPANQIPPSTDATKLALGDTFACALHADGRVSCWGGPAGCPFGSVAHTYWCHPGASSDGSHDVALGQRALAIATGTRDQVACALLEDGSVKCWGGPSPCRVENDATVCHLPTPDDVVGASIEVVGTDANWAYGEWRAIDLAAPP
jgi:hypothetical protein